MKTEELLEKYFEGTTTCEEEQRLRHFFATDKVPEHLEVYRPLFACIDREAEALRRTRKDNATELSLRTETASRAARLHRLYYLTTGIAAALLLYIGIAALLPRATHSHTGYAIIDGTYCNDPQLVQAKALEALQNVGFTDEELRDNIIHSLP